jgi:hypothetical protein|eukprot:SAG25_NODE_927_length_4715_cov_2.119584_6_plen_48_part_00
MHVERERFCEQALAGLAGLLVYAVAAQWTHRNLLPLQTGAWYNWTTV